MSDQEMEKEIVKKGLVYPRITNDEIEKKMLAVKYDCHIVPGTTTTVITAYIPMKHLNFTLCTEIMACVDPRNFNKELGEKYGIEKAAKSAKDKLWELEGYSLASKIASVPTSAKDRLALELEELTTKSNGLLAFLDSSSSDMVTAEQHTMLVKQKSVMVEYASVLNNRLSAWVDCPDC